MLLNLQEQFLEKNNDALHSNLEFLIAESTNGLVKHIYNSGADAGKPTNQKSANAGKLNFVSVGSKFRSQLVVLLDKLKSTVSFLLDCGSVYCLVAMLMASRPLESGVYILENLTAEFYP